jgi:hypothetical protein
MASLDDRGAVPSAGDRRARAATAVVFFVTGFVVAAWATRIPAVQERLALTPGSFALAALAVMAAANSVVDVAMNAQGIELERRYRRPILSGLHAAHPLGMLAGGLGGTTAAAAGLAVLPHFALAATAGLLTGLAATRWLVTEPRRPRQPLLARPSGRLLVLGAIAFCAFLLDGAASNWSAAHLHGAHAASPALAAAGFSALTAALALARLTGDRLIARLGRRLVVQASGLVAAAGAILVVAAPTAPVALLGWATLGAGLAAIAPAVLGAVPSATGLAPPVAVAAVTTLGYLGSFTGPPLVGALAELTGLSTALGLLVAAALVPVLLAGRALSRGQPSLR